MGLAGTVLFVVGHLSHLDQCDILNMISDDSDLAASKAVVVVHNLRGITDKVKFEAYRTTVAESFAAHMVERTVDGCYRLEGISEGLCPRLTQFFLANDDMQWGRDHNVAIVRAVRSALSKSSKVDFLSDFLSQLEQVLPRYFFTSTLLTVEVRGGNRLALKLPPGAPVPEISLLGIQASAAMPTPIRLRELCKSKLWYIFHFEAAGVVDVRNLVLESASGRHRLKFEVDVNFTVAPAFAAVQEAVARYNGGNHGADEDDEEAATDSIEQKQLLLAMQNARVVIGPPQPTTYHVRQPVTVQDISTGSRMTWLSDNGILKIFVPCVRPSLPSQAGAAASPQA